MPIDDDIFNDLLRVLEDTYAERQVYQAIAQRVPNWKEVFDAEMQPDSDFRKDVARSFVTVKERLLARQKFADILRDLKTHYLQ
jgi:hypothetical protein